MNVLKIYLLLGLLSLTVTILAAQRSISSFSRSSGSREKRNRQRDRTRLGRRIPSIRGCRRLKCRPDQGPLLERKRQPNIIFIMADDLGWNDVGFHNRLINTPNIDRLAKNGIELTDTHAQPLCSPSRASILTGKYASNTGLQQLVVLGQSKSCLPVEHKLWPEFMKERGYTTKMVGKWHLGSCNRRCLPTNRGFDEFRGILENQASYFNWTDLGVMNRLVNDRPSIRNIGTHLAIQHRRDTVAMIKAHAKRKNPLFMFISPLAVHQPLDVTADMFNRHRFLDSTDPAENNRRRFLGLVAALDDLVGATIKALKDTNQFENSIIVFTSDNGGPSGDLDFPAPFPFLSFSNNYPLRGGKSSFYDGGTKVPTIYYDPRLPSNVKGTKRNFLMHISDWLPTTVNLADPTFRSGKIDGVSQVKNLGARYRPSRKYRVRSELLIGITDYTSPTLTSECADADAAFRWRDWKLIYGKVATAVEMDMASMWLRPIENLNLPQIMGDDCMRRDSNGDMVARCLFNLKEDKLEQRNLFDSRPNIVRRLLGKINQFKDASVQNVYRNPLGVTAETTESFRGFTVPRFDFCMPSVDFPLIPQNASCSNSRGR